MSDAYVECLVKAKASAGGKFLKIFLIVLAAVMGLLMMLTFNILFFLLAVAAGVGAYFVNMFTDLEYEYLYLDRELTIDKVMAKTRRKRVAVYQLDRMEILAPVKSYHLDNFKNRNVKVKDYSIGYEDKPDLRYAMFYEGGEKLLLSPSPEMIKVMKNAAPRKIFSD
ncbi:hypothetical protein IMSAG185_00237 [Lachnospiraceae bacterium]|jgi:hypothetical protein|nr:hypothetical protein [Lachnospiraceae bacterium]GFI64648.1 hypothetical protein IMSAG185_00237 [Lachnospiraceae bacterium]